MTKTPIYVHTESGSVLETSAKTKSLPILKPDDKHSWKLIDIKLITLENGYQYFIYTWESID